MPLHQTKDYNFKFAPYELKVRLVEEKCVGCGFYCFQGADDKDIPIFGCTYPFDTCGINKNLREPYVTVVEIASNGCVFWNETEPLKYDSEPGDWNDKALLPHGISESSVLTIGIVEFTYGKETDDGRTGSH